MASKFKTISSENWSRLSSKPVSFKPNGCRRNVKLTKTVMIKRTVCLTRSCWATWIWHLLWLFWEIELPVYRAMTAKYMNLSIQTPGTKTSIRTCKFNSLQLVPLCKPNMFWRARAICKHKIIHQLQPTNTTLRKLYNKIGTKCLQVTSNSFKKVLLIHLSKPSTQVHAELKTYLLKRGRSEFKFKI